MNKQQLAAKIWASANKMRSKIEANEYKDYILGFIFYKFLSDKEVAYLKSQGWGEEDFPEGLVEEDDETLMSCQNNIGYFIPYKHLYSTWLSMGKDFGIGNVTDALNSFNRSIGKNYKHVYEKIFDALSGGLSKLGDTDEKRSKAISDLIQLIKDIPTDGSEDYDVLGFIYEYLISKFASNAGKKAGEFYTPHEVSTLMAEIVAYNLRGHKTIQIYDPTSGSGSLLITIGKAVGKYLEGKDNVKYYAQELKSATYNLTRMNLIMRGILPNNIVTRNNDTLEDDWPYFDEADPEHTYQPLFMDAVVSNPPYSQPWDPKDKDADPRFKAYGIAPKGKADYAFLLHDLYHIKPDGIVTIVLPHGVLFRGGDEGEIREHLIERNNIDAVIGLPANIFYGTSIPTIIMVLKKNKPDTSVLIIDASKGFVKDGKQNRLRDCDIRRIVDAVKARKDVDKFCKLVSREEIRANGYNLNIPRYVDSNDAPETWDVNAIMNGGIPDKEIDAFADYWDALPSLRAVLFKEKENGYSEISSNHLESAIGNSEDVATFKKNFASRFDGFEQELSKTLIDGIETVNEASAGEAISMSIFSRLSGLPLVNPYDAYQLFSDRWGIISQDIESIQTEGKNALTQVDPNMVAKKDKNGKEIEVQDGYVGHILPFDLVQDALLCKEKSEISSIGERLEEIENEYGEILESIDEEDKDGQEWYDVDASSFESKGLATKVKEIRKEMKRGVKYAADSVEAKLLQADGLVAEEKALKKDQKTKSAELSAKTKETIESLSEDQAVELLKKKWFEPLMESLNKLPSDIIQSLVKRIKALDEKYQMSFSSLEDQIESSEKELTSMIDDLTGGESDMKGLEDLKRILKGE